MFHAQDAVLCQPLIVNLNNDLAMLDNFLQELESVELLFLLFYAFLHLEAFLELFAQFV